MSLTKPLPWSLVADLRLKDPPDLRGASADEFVAVRSIQRAMYDMVAAYEHLTTASSLNQISRAQNQLNEMHSPSGRFWMTTSSISRRQATQSLWDLKVAIDDTKSQTRHIASWNERIDNKKIRAATKLFSRSFPWVEHARDAVSHPEIARVEPGKHRLEGEVTWVNCQVNDAVVMTFKGHYIEFRLNADTMTTIKQVVEDIFDAYKDVAVQRYA